MQSSYAKMNRTRTHTRSHSHTRTSLKSRERLVQIDNEINKYILSVVRKGRPCYGDDNDDDCLKVVITDDGVDETLPFSKWFRDVVQIGDP